MLGAITAAVAALTAALTLAAGGALAGSSTHIVSAFRISTPNETVVVDAHGRTLYALHPETVHHLLCRSHECFENWPPLLVRSAHVHLRAGAGVSGHLGILRRRNGKFQVTLRGMPLYRFAGDGAKGDANGEGIQSFGGTWHAVTASTTPAPVSPAPAPTPAPTPTTPAPKPYAY